MASITQLPLATGAKQDETLILRSARNDRKQKSPRATAAEQSSEYLDLQRSSNAVYEMTAGKKGSVRLRLARFGRKQAPFYRIHVADSRWPRDGKFIEKIGYYDPRPGKDGEKRIAVNVERAKYWLSVGAQPSDTVRRLLSMAGLLQRPLVSEMPEPKKGGKGNVDARPDSIEDKGK